MKTIAQRLRHLATQTDVSEELLAIARELETRECWTCHHVATPCVQCMSTKPPFTQWEPAK
jgi:hypothetical protein